MVRPNGSRFARNVFGDRVAGGRPIRQTCDFKRATAASKMALGAVGDCSGWNSDVYVTTMINGYRSAVTEARSMGGGKLEHVTCGKTQSRWPDPVACPFHDFRRCRLNVFPYSVIYTLRQNRVVVVAVSHSKRLPLYWKDRLA